jgi:hypothetical protein
MSVGPTFKVVMLADSRDKAPMGEHGQPEGAASFFSLSNKEPLSRSKCTPGRHRRRSRSDTNGQIRTIKRICHPC